MTALTLLDFAWFVINVVEWVLLAAIVAGVLWFIAAFAAARADEQRVERIAHHPSNVTRLPHVRPFDFEADA